MEERKILTIQDISCYGQCSITVALPVLSAFGYETAILPSAILSNHTAGFHGFTCLDLSDEINKILNQWKIENIKYDVLYSGYLGDIKHFDILRELKNNYLNKNSLFIFDPVMADNGKLYPAFNDDYVKAMKPLIKETDIIIPNLTEACLLSDVPYKEKYDINYIKEVINSLLKLGAKKIVLTGISFKENMTGVLVYDNGYQYYEHEKLKEGSHGTGDVYSSMFIGFYLRNNDLFRSAKLAADFVLEALKYTKKDSSHWYGVKFEPLLLDFIKNNI